MHVFQMVRFNADNRPVQFVVGNSGTLLDYHFPRELDDNPRLGYRVAGQRTAEQVSVKTVKKYGFLALEKGSDPAAPWTATLHTLDARGEVLAPSLSCKMSSSKGKHTPECR
jgi:hypothetical protein